MYVPLLATNALQAHHASVHGGVSAKGLSDICLILFEMSCIDGRAFHYLVVVGEKNISQCVGRVS